MNLGMALGVRYPALKKIKKEQHEDIEDCKREMLADWLQKKNCIASMKPPTWVTLRDSLQEIGENEVAARIPCDSKWNLQLLRGIYFGAIEIGSAEQQCQILCTYISLPPSLYKVYMHSSTCEVLIY